MLKILQALNKAWILLQDFEFTDSDDEGSWVLLTSTDLPGVLPKPTRLLTVTEPIHDQGLADSTFDEIGIFVRDNATQLANLNITTYNWIIIDQTGLDSSTCILVHRLYNEGKKEIGHDFNAIRIPFTEAWSMFTNLDIANMDFEDWADMDAGVQGDGAYKWVGPFPDSNAILAAEREKAEAKREVALKVAKDLGHVY
jgi:hypothetical protein